MDLVDENVIVPLQTFVKNSKHLVQKCTKPNQTDFNQVGTATVMGFALMGFIGFFVKLIFIPINNVIMGQSSS
jgi:protein transport protein SEC61 subunit gamma and related proteins